MEETAPRARVEELLRHREWVRVLARALTLDESRADDLEQELWLRALEAPPRDLRSPRGWLARAVRRLASNLRRSERRRARREDGAPPARETPGPVDLVAEAEAHRRVVAAVLDLEEPYRTALLERFFEGIPTAEMARRRGTPVETVRTRVKRGLARVRERLDGEHGGDRGAWRAALLPLAAPAGPGAGGGGPPPGLILGGTLMTMQAKVGIAAAAVLLLCIVGWLALGGGDAGAVAPKPAGGGGAVVAAADPPKAPPAQDPAPPAPAPAQAPPPAPPPPAAPPPAAPPAPKPAEDPAGEVRGRVTLEDGTPLADALVFLGPASRMRGDEPFKPFVEARIKDGARTGADGTFSLKGPGREVTVWHPERSPRTVRRAEASEIRLPPRAVLRGRLVDAAGKPVADAEVALDRARKVRTGAAGEFAFVAVEAGVRGLLLPGRRMAAVRLAPGEDAEAEIGPGLPEVRLEVRAGGKPFADPLFGVLVGLDRVASVHEVKGKGGAANLAGVLPGRFVLLGAGGLVARLDVKDAAAAVDLGPATLVVRAPAGTSLALAPGEADELVDLFAMRVGHRPVPPAGSLAFPGLADGAYRLLVESPAGSGLLVDERPVRIEGGRDASLDL